MIPCAEPGGRSPKSRGDAFAFHFTVSVAEVLFDRRPHRPGVVAVRCERSDARRLRNKEREGDGLRGASLKS